MKKDNTAVVLMHDQNEEKINSMQIKLNSRDADLVKMENLLLEMHRKMDDLKHEKHAAEAESKQSVKINCELESELKLVRQEAS